MGELNLIDGLIKLDDVIFSDTFEEPLKRLDEVLTRLEEHDINLNLSKYEFFKSNITYIGYVVSDDGVETDTEKALKPWHVSSSVKELRSFLCFTELVQTSSNKKQGKPKTRIKKTQFVWGTAQQKAFNDMLESMTNSPILKYADYTKLLGAVLFQEHDVHDRVVAYASRSLKPSERSHPTHKLEYLALKSSIVDKFHDYLYGATFDVVTENNPLVHVYTSAKLDATGHRWMAELAK